MLRRLVLTFYLPLTLTAADATLRPGDQLLITVFDNPDLGLTVRVPASGTVDFPLIGALPPLTTTNPQALAQLITARLADGYLRSPQVTVTVTDYAPRQVHVLGNVVRAGPVRLQPGVTLSVLQALSEAGGFDATANRAGAILIRTSASGQRTTIALDLSDPRTVHDQTVQPDDLLVVPAADRAYVLGKVAKPGAIVFPGTEPISVAKAISLAGGFDRFAIQDAVQILRPGQAPRVVDVEAVLNGKADDQPLLPGDTVMVPESRL